MRESLLTSIDYYLLPNKILCGAAGLWPIDEKSSTFTKVFAYLRLINGFLAMLSFVVPEIMQIALNWGDIRILAEAGSILTTSGQCLFKMTYLVIRRERTGRLYNEIRSLWLSSYDVKERQSYEKLAYWARICTIVFFASCMCTVVSFPIGSAMKSFKGGYSNNETRELPYDVWYGVDVSTSPNFEIAFTWQVLTDCISSTILSGLDASFMTLILHVAGQFRLISTWINGIGVEIKDGNNDPTKLRADLIRCIRHHQRMTNVVNDVNNLLTPIVFVQILASAIEICLSGFTLAEHGSGDTDVISFITYIIAIWTQLLMLCWPGEILIEGSQEISHVVYLDVPWYDLPPTYQRELYLVIIRAQRHCSITALTFETLSIHTLTSVFKSAASYFTFLREIQEN